MGTRISSAIDGGLGIMLEERETQNHTPLGLIPPLKTIMPWRVSEVTPLADFRLHVIFQDGVQGIVCLQQRVASENAGVFKSLADKAVFDGVTVRHGDRKSVV